MTTATKDFAATVDRTLYEAPGVPAVPTIGHRVAVPAGAPVDIRRVARPVDVDRTLRHVAGGLPALSKPADTSEVPPSLALHALQTADIRPADSPLPGTEVASPYDPWRPLQHMAGPAPVASPCSSDTGGYGSLDAALTAAQAATVARSRGKLDRARAYAGRLGTHAAEIRAKLATASEHQVAAAIGKTEMGPSDVGPLRGELIEIERQHKQALTILADVETEHARHEADLAALIGSDGAARAKLAAAHAVRTLAQTAADAACAILDRATAHADAVNRKLVEARETERCHDADATAQLRAALADGDPLPAAAEPFLRTSPALEDDLRAARATVDVLTAEHAARVEALASAHRAVLGAVDQVMMVDAEAAARELRAADSRALALRTRLHTFVQRTAGDYVTSQAKPLRELPNGMFEREVEAYSTVPRTVPSTAVISNVIALAPPPPHEGVYVQNWIAESGAWDAYAAALAADPKAEPVFGHQAAVPPSAPLPVRAS